MPFIKSPIFLHWTQSRIFSGCCASCQLVVTYWYQYQTKIMYLNILSHLLGVRLWGCMAWPFFLSQLPPGCLLYLSHTTATVQSATHAFLPLGSVAPWILSQSKFSPSSLFFVVTRKVTVTWPLCLTPTFSLSFPLFLSPFVPGSCHSWLLLSSFSSFFLHLSLSFPLVSLLSPFFSVVFFFLPVTFLAHSS